MSLIIVAVVSLIEAALVSAVLYKTKSHTTQGTQPEGASLNNALVDRRALTQSLETMYSALVPHDRLKHDIAEMLQIKEALKVDRGRVTITYAELETLEGRLRELHEIERELNASGLETQEELKILQQKEQELKDKNETLKAQLRESLQQLEELTGELEMTTQMSSKIEKMKSELTHCQKTIDQLLLQIEEGNQLYVKMKRRYDALDIEYAQLYEKFAESPISK